MLGDALAVLSEELTAHASVAATYRRASLSATVYVTLDSHLLRVGDGRGGLKVERPDLTATFAATELVLGGVQERPANGDYLDVTLGDVVKRFQVMAPAATEPAWRYCDPQQARVLVHAKYVGVV